jgi:hypothetical protein
MHAQLITIDARAQLRWSTASLMNRRTSTHARAQLVGAAAARIDDATTQQRAPSREPSAGSGVEA